MQRNKPRMLPTICRGSGVVGRDSKAAGWAVSKDSGATSRGSKGVGQGLRATFMIVNSTNALVRT